jgi:hypothetical protein
MLRKDYLPYFELLYDYIDLTFIVYRYIWKYYIRYRINATKYHRLMRN